MYPHLFHFVVSLFLLPRDWNCLPPNHPLRTTTGGNQQNKDPIFTSCRCTNKQQPQKSNYKKSQVDSSFVQEEEEEEEDTNDDGRPLDSTNDLSFLKHENRDEVSITTATLLEASRNPPKFVRLPRNHRNAQEWDRNERTYIARLFVTFQECLSHLGGPDQKNVVSRQKLEEMAIFVHDSMSVSSRNYHSVQHLFDISKDLEDPIGILGILFHDVIYYHVDGKLSKQQKFWLQDVYQEEEQEETPIENGGSRSTKKLVFRGNPQDVDTKPLIALVSTIFGYQQDEEITVEKGLNEFLSAVVAVQMLEEHVDIEILAQVACCIEGTIPFRNNYNIQDPSTNPFEKLYKNMVVAKHKFHLQLSEEDLIAAVQLAVIVANEDVGNFGSTDRYHFLDKTWSLLPELNVPLRTPNLCTVKQYQEAMHNMNVFFNVLHPSAVFASFRGFPSPPTIRQFADQTIINFQIGKTYVGAKYLSASVLAAFAEVTGGDIPVSLFMGELPSRRNVLLKNTQKSQRLEDSLPKHEKSDIQNHCHMLVYEILENGRKSETTFDIQQSPLSAYLYGHLGDTGLEELLSTQTMFPMDTERATTLLQALPKPCVHVLAKSLSVVAVSRSEAFETIRDTYA